MRSRTNMGQRSERSDAEPPNVVAGLQRNYRRLLPMRRSVLPMQSGTQPSGATGHVILAGKARRDTKLDDFYSKVRWMPQVEVEQRSERAETSEQSDGRWREAGRR